MDIAKLRARTIAVISKYTSYYVYSNPDEQLFVSSGLLNVIWNNWCQFWRNYWIFTIQGGIYLDKTLFAGIYPAMTRIQACAYAAHLKCTPPKRSYNLGETIDFYKEPTWGDYDVIVNIAANLSGMPALSARMNYLIALLPTYQNELKEFQRIRNAFIHLNEGAVKDLETLRPLYIFGSDNNIVNILNATRVGHTSPCFKAMTDNMLGVLCNLYEK